MVRRNLRSDFVGGAYVFPGGAVDPARRRRRGRGAVRRAEPTPRPVRSSASNPGGLAYWVAVVRETFEEAGLLLARREGGPDLLAGDPDEEARFVAARAEVNAGTPPLPRPLPRRAPAPRRRRHPLLRPLDHPAGRPPPLRHPVLRGGRPAGADRRARRRRDHRRGLDHAARRVGPAPGGRDRDHLPDHPQPPGHRPLRLERRAARRRPSGPRARCRPSSRGWSPTGTACASCSRATPATSEAPVPDPGGGEARGDFNEAVRAVSMKANEEGPDAAPGPRPGRRPRRRP